MLNGLITKILGVFKSILPSRKNSSLSLKTIEGINRQKMAQLSLGELENLVYRYEEDYFKYLGEDHIEVKDFKKAVESKSLPELKKAIDNLGSSVIKLERESGHRGRPLIMDYYFWYEHAIEELEKRVI